MIGDVAAVIAAVFAFGAFALVALAITRIDDLRIDVKALLLHAARNGAIVRAADEEGA